MAEREVSLTLASGARVGLPEDEARWLRDELLGGRLRSPKREAGLALERALKGTADPTAAEMTAANLVELAWALRGMLEQDSERFVGSPLLMHLRDLLFVEADQEREGGRLAPTRDGPG
jgi:hypothetical protein